MSRSVPVDGTILMFPHINIGVHCAIANALSITRSGPFGAGQRLMAEVRDLRHSRAHTIYIYGR